MTSSCQPGERHGFSLAWLSSAAHRFGAARTSTSFDPYFLRGHGLPCLNALKRRDPAFDMSALGFLAYRLSLQPDNGKPATVADAGCLTLDKRQPMRASLVMRSLRVLTCCFASFSRRLVPVAGGKMVRTRLPGRLNISLPIGSAAIAVACYGASRGFV